MPIFHIKSASMTIADRDIDAEEYTQEGEFFVFWESTSGSAGPGQIRYGKLLTVRLKDVESIERKP